MKNFLLSFLFGLSACAGRIDTKAAMSNEFMSPQLEVSDVKEELESVRSELEGLGYSFQKKQSGDMTTTLYNVILLDSEFEDMGDPKKLRVLRHELVHAKQWRKFGAAGFASKYSVEGKRWVLEMHGYRQDIRDMCDMKLPRKTIIKRIDQVSDEFPSNYKLIALEHAKVKEATLFVLSEEFETYESCPHD